MHVHPDKLSECGRTRTKKSSWIIGITYFKSHFFSSIFQGTMLKVNSRDCCYVRPVQLLIKSLFSPSNWSESLLHSSVKHHITVIRAPSMFCKWLIKSCEKIKGSILFVLNNIIRTVSNCVKNVTINQGYDYLVCIIRNIGVKLHQLVQRWARVSASAHLKGNTQLPIAWGTPSWDGLMTGSDWLESLMGFMSASKSAKSNTTRHEITVWYKVMVEIIAYTHSSSYWLCRSGSLNRDVQWSIAHYWWQLTEIQTEGWEMQSCVTLWLQ